MLLYSIDKKSKFSRKRPNEEEGDITYINEHNRVFNKKVRLPSAAWFVSTLTLFPRLHATTTSTLQRSAQASSGERRFEVVLYWYIGIIWMYDNMLER
jgi:hypothetical protein